MNQPYYTKLFMQIKHLAIFFVGLLVLSHCNRTTDMPKSYFEARIQVTEAIDSTGNAAGFEFLLYSQDSETSPRDTLFIQETDSAGFLGGPLSFVTPGAYPLQISRDGAPILSMRVLVADQDSIRFTGQFPDIQQSIRIDSREQRAVEVFDRVDAGFTRTRRFMAVGAIADSMIVDEMRKWAVLYEQVADEYPGTFAASFALEASVQILSDIDSNEMLRMIDKGLSQNQSLGLALTYGKDAVTQSRGLSGGMHYLDSLKTLVDSEDQLRAIEQMVVELYYDSLKVSEGLAALKKFKRSFEQQEELSYWYKNMRFELEDLAPGAAVPDFEFVSTEGDTVNQESIKGNLTLLEFTLMENGLYQDQYDQLTVSYQLFADSGLSIYTMAFDESSTTILAFFEERDRFWSLAEPPSMDRKRLLEDFNIQFYPTRVLIDQEGNIVRKFIGEELDDVIPYITSHLATD